MRDIIEQKMAAASLVIDKAEAKKIEKMFNARARRLGLNGIVQVLAGTNGMAGLTFVGPAEIFSPPVERKLEPGGVWRLSPEGLRWVRWVEKWLKAMGYFVPLSASTVNHVEFQKYPETGR